VGTASHKQGTVPLFGGKRRKPFRSGPRKRAPFVGVWLILCVTTTITWDVIQRRVTALSAGVDYSVVLATLGWGCFKTLFGF